MWASQCNGSMSLLAVLQEQGIQENNHEHRLQVKQQSRAGWCDASSFVSLALFLNWIACCSIAGRRGSPPQFSSKGLPPRRRKAESILSNRDAVWHQQERKAASVITTLLGTHCWLLCAAPALPLPSRWQIVPDAAQPCHQPVSPAHAQRWVDANTAGDSWAW